MNSESNTIEKLRIDEARADVVNARKLIDRHEKVIEMLATIDTSMLDQICIGSVQVILSVRGIENHRALRRGMKGLGIKWSRCTKCDNGSHHIHFSIPELDGGKPWNESLVIIVNPDTTVCELVKVGETVTPVYKVKCS